MVMTHTHTLRSPTERPMRHKFYNVICQIHIIWFLQFLNCHMPMTEMPFSQGHFLWSSYAQMLTCRKAQRCTIPSINKFTPHCSTASVNSIHLQQDKAKQDKTKDNTSHNSLIRILKWWSCFLRYNQSSLNWSSAESRHCICQYLCCCCGCCHRCIHCFGRGNEPLQFEGGCQCNCNLHVIQRHCSVFSLRGRCCPCRCSFNNCFCYIRSRSGCCQLLPCFQLPLPGLELGAMLELSNTNHVWKPSTNTKR